MKKIECVIFDMDGVIINTEPLHKKAYYKTFKSLDLEVPEELYHSLTGSSTINVFENLITHYQLTEDANELVLRKRGFFNELFYTDKELDLIDGVLEIINYFYVKNKILVLASSASMETINRVFTRFDLDKYFIKKLSGADLTASKPHPEIFEKAVLASKIPKENCMIIEDSDNGILAANSAKIYCVGYRSEHSKLQTLENANLIIDDFSELKNLF